MTLSLVAAFLYLASIPSSAAVESPCLLLGPDYPAPRRLTHSQTFAAARDSVLSTVNEALQQAGPFGQLNATDTSFSIDVFSLHEDASLLNFHHSGTNLANPKEGVAKVDSSTIYRIGSMSKMLTVYLFLAAMGDTSWNEPITKYVPELAEYAADHQVDSLSIEYVDWESITIGALASQLGGLFRDFAFGPDTDASLQPLEFPVVPPVPGKFCGAADELAIPCDRAAFFENWFVQRPSVPSFYSPVYSNSAYQILTYALENMTSESYVELFQNYVADPLSLESTYVTVPPSSSNSIVPVDAITSWYDYNFRDEVPAAGMYSSINDLRTIGLSILNSTLLSPAQTRRWMKPHSFTASVNGSVGAPWEIFRQPTEHVSWMYSKGGAVGSYGSEIILLPDYDVGIAILAAGDTASAHSDKLSNIVTAIITPALEEAAKGEATVNYAGTYIGQQPQSRITVVADDGPGFGISEWTWNGTDFFAIAQALVLHTSTDDPHQNTSIRLWPSGLSGTDKNGVQTAAGWRAVVGALPDIDATPGPFLGPCIGWFRVDQITYGGVGFDDFVFNLDSSSTKATSLEPRVVRDVYSRV